ncbi:MAG: DUF6456 domain-containing protein [Parvibaculum sp.]
MSKAEREFERELRRLFRRLAEPGHRLADMPDGRVGLFGPRGRKPLATTDAAFRDLCEARELVEAAGGKDGAVSWRASETGRAFYRRLSAEAEPFREQHQIRSQRRLQTGKGEGLVTVNEAETPLGWLRRRKGADGKPLLSATQFEAGERLRRDFTLAQLTPRVTVDWSAVAVSGRRARDPAEIADIALAARQRVGRAVVATGPHLSDILLSVCCHLEGLEAAERGFGWPRRSAKLVLQIALDRLAAHYGMKEEKAQAVAATARASD